MVGLSITTGGKGKLLAVVAAAMLSFVVALGFAAPMQASAAEGGAGLAAGSVQATTQGDVTMRNPEWVTLWAGDKSGYSAIYFVNGAIDSRVITKVVSSDSSVLKVEKRSLGQNYQDFNVLPLKVGKAKLSITYKQNGATKTISETYAVKALPGGISSITFNGEKMPAPTATAAVRSGYCFGFKGTSATVKATASKGWEITSIKAYLHHQKTGANKIVDVTNGKAFTLPKNYEGSIDIQFYNSISHVYFSYSVQVFRHKPLELASKSTYYIGYPKLAMPHYDYRLRVEDLGDIEILSVKSSKPGVIKAKGNKKFEKVTLQAKKVGTSKVTIKYKYGNKTFTTSSKCTVAKDYPIAKVQVNGKSVNLKKNSGGYTLQKYKKNSAKVKITAAKGWKVSSLKYYSGYDDIKGKTVKNGASVKTPKGKATIVVATLKKGKSTYRYSWYFNRA